MARQEPVAKIHPVHRQAQGMLPTVTVITPSFNQGKYIERTILSVAAQRKHYPAIEHIIVDGQSKDDTVSILQQYSHTIRWISEPDRGFADAVNKGLKMASGEILGIQSSDDLYTEGAIRTAVDYLIEDVHLQMVFGYYDYIDEEDRIIQTGRPYPSFTLEGYLCLDFVIPQPSTFFRKKVLETVGYLDLKVDYVADMEFWIRIASQYAVQSIPRCLSCVRVHGEARNATSTRFGNDWIAAIEKNLRAGTLKLNSGQIQRVYAAAYLFDSGYERANGQLSEAFRKTWRALKTSPGWVLRKRSILLAKLLYSATVPARMRKLIGDIKRCICSWRHKLRPVHVQDSE
jgi:glycosyltransferase involved in cell wall biosynthesis